MDATGLDWATAIGTVAAAVVPACLFVIEWRGRKNAEFRAEAAEAAARDAEDRYRREELARREAKDAEDASAREQSQAQAVSVWMAGGFGDPVRLAFRNRSDQPVIDVEVTGMGTYVGPGSPFALDTRKAEFHVDTIPPTGEEGFTLELHELHPMIEGGPVHGDLLHVALDSVVFTDAETLSWERKLPTGQLVRLEDRDPYIERMIYHLAKQRARKQVEQAQEQGS